MTEKFRLTRRPFLAALPVAGLLPLGMGGRLFAQDTGTEKAEPQASAALLVRRNVKSLSAQERADFVEAMWRLKRTPSPVGDEVGNWYDHFVASHMRKLVAWSDEPGQGGYGHNGPDLMTWHRKLLLEFEEAMSTVMAKPMTVPYWDWTDPTSNDIIFADDFMGPGGDPNDGYYVKSGPFRYGEWRLNVKGFPSHNPGQFSYLVRALGQMAEMNGVLPLPEEVQQALLRPVYDTAPWGVQSDMDKSFRAFVDGNYKATGTVNNGGVIGIEGIQGSLLHGTVHMWVGGQTAEGHLGSLADTATSPNDPVFWLHHSNIDRIAESWWTLHDWQYLPKSGGPRGTNLHDKMAPYQVTNAEMARPVEELGYTYDTLIAPDPEIAFRTADEWVDLVDALCRTGY